MSNGIYLFIIGIIMSGMLGLEKREISVVFLLFFYLAVDAQHNQWVWVTGDTLNNASVYGTKGVPAPGNFPGGRYEACEWTDNQGKFWMYGGFNLKQVHSKGDLWKYDPATGLWSWENGALTHAPPVVYAAPKGVGHIGNTPGNRLAGVPTWVDTSGSLWLLGGNINNLELRNDLWKYDVNSGVWTWMSGSNLPNQKGMYGTKGATNASSVPGARQETACSWTDSNNNLWLFGGYGFDGDSSKGYLNDLWMYNTTTNLWAWMGGDTTIDMPSTYGTKGVPSTQSVPGGRMIYSNWIDLSGSLWLFGGVTDALGTLQNDLWKFDPTTGLWTWMAGPGVSQHTGLYLNKCISTPATVPASRYENRENWVDACGNFWTFGGISLGAKKLNDLWMYSRRSNEWMWISGDSIPNRGDIYGTQGVFSPLNMPGGKSGGAAWQDSTGFWMYGGNNVKASTNVMWKYVPDKPTASFTANNDTACVPASIIFTNASVPNCNEIKSYLWSFGDVASGSQDTSSLKDPVHLYRDTGTYLVQLIVTSCTGSRDTAYKTIVIKSLAQASVSQNDTICFGDTATISASGGVYYAWSNGSTTSNITVSPSANSTYTVIIDDGFCFDTNQVEVFVNPNPSFTPQPDTTIVSGRSTTIGYTTSYQYSWTPSNGLTCTDCASPTVSIAENTTYYVRITDPLTGCEAYDTINVIVESDCNEPYIPNAFSPNGDGQNDLFQIEGECFSSFYIAIYSRWGEKVYESRDPFFSWDGSFRSIKLNTGVFTFYINGTLENLEEPYIKVGQVNLIR